MSSALLALSLYATWLPVLAVAPSLFAVDVAVPNYQYLCMLSAEGAANQAVQQEQYAQPTISQYQQRVVQQQILDTYLG